jgi:hypothetical protein
MMLAADDLPKLAAELQAYDIDAQDAWFMGLKGMQRGLLIGIFFYPLWELNLDENALALGLTDFAAIRAHRRSGWTIDNPD